MLCVAVKSVLGCCVVAKIPPGKARQEWVVGLADRATALLEQGSSVGLWDVARQVTGK